MQTVQLNTIERFFVNCPHCGSENEHEVTHLMDEKYQPHAHFGPWQCDECGWNVSFTIHSKTKSATITKVTERPKSIRGFLLLRIAPSKIEKPIHFIVEHTIHTRDLDLKSYDEEMASLKFLVEEHQCPVNWLGVLDVFEGNDHDPHDLFEFAGFAIRPDDWDRDEPNWLTLFPQLSSDGLEIEGTLAANPLQLE